MSSRFILISASILMISWFVNAREAAASVDFVNQWPVKPVIISNSSTGTVSGKFTPGLGTNRLMLVAVATEYTSASTPGLTVTYGGQAVTQIVTTGSFVNGLWLGYVKEGGVAAGAAGNRTLLVVNTVTANLTAMYATVAVFNGVDQTTPITGSNAAATAGAASLALTVPLTGNAGLTGNTGMSVYLANWNGQTSTPATGYTEVRDYAGTSFNLAACYNVITGTVNETPTSTAAASAAGAAAGVSINPVTKANGGTNYAAITTCGDCHGNFPNDGGNRNRPFGMFSGSHERHTGGSNSNNQYAFVCTQCHYNNTTTTHAGGYVNITGSSLPGNAYSIGKQVPFTNNPTLGTCNNVTCHSSGRATRQYAVSPNWGGGKTTCLSCHGGRNSVSGQASRSNNNFSMSTTHSQHLKYLTTEINCQLCHGKTAANHTALKDYTGVQYHANGSKSVFFTNIAYGSYTSYKSPLSGSSGTTKTCNNTACHGGQSRSGWSESSAVNSDHTCAHCHGTANTTVAQGNADRRLFAPGFRKTGTSTDQSKSSANLRVGSHFKHLSSAYMRNLKCNECHLVPYKPFDSGTNHTLNNLRFNSGTLTFAQASTAKWDGTTNTQLAAFSGYTNGTVSKAATCSSVYCHGNRLKNNEAGGTYRKPYWNYTAMINYTDTAANVCSRCHGYPPTANGHSSSTTCSTCHSNIKSSDNKTFVDKLLHINRNVEASGSDCLGCHGSSKTKTKPSAGTIRQVNGAGGDFVRLSRHVSNGTATEIVTKWDCIVCHREGDASSATGATDTTLHGNDSGTGLVQLRNVDTPTTGWAINNKSMDEQMRYDMDTFCLTCHDSNGAAGITVNGTNTGMTTTSVTRNLTPFNTNDTLKSGRDTQTATNAVRTRVLDVKTQFYAGTYTWNGSSSAMPTGFTSANYNGNPSQHAVLGPRYFGNNASWTSAAWTTHVNRAGQTMNVTREKARLHCSDCHLTESNAHGATNSWWMLLNGTPNDYTSDSSQTGTTFNSVNNICLKCHSTSIYALNKASETVSRFDHGNEDGNTQANWGVSYLGPNCTLCHGGNNVLGTIHGTNSTTETYNTGGSTNTVFTRYRFLPGTWMRYKPGTDDATAWTNSTVSASCYFSGTNATAGTAESMSACGHHGPGGAGTGAAAPRYGRATKY